MHLCVHVLDMCSLRFAVPSGHSAQVICRKGTLARWPAGSFNISVTAAVILDGGRCKAFKSMVTRVTVPSYPTMDLAQPSSAFVCYSDQQKIWAINVSPAGLALGRLFVTTSPASTQNGLTCTISSPGEADYVSVSFWEPAGMCV